MKLSSLLAPLIARKADHDAIMDVVLAFEAEQLDGLTKRRENDAKRQAEKRKRDESHVTSRDVTVTVASHASASPAPDLENKQTNKPERKQDSAPTARVGLAEFKAKLHPLLDDERIEALCAVRRKKGAVFSAHAGSLLVKALLACPDPAVAADEMVLRNWTGIKPDWLESRGGAPPGRKRNFVDAALDRINGTNGHGSEGVFGNNGDAQRLSTGRAEPRSDVADLRSGLSRRFVSGNH